MKPLVMIKLLAYLDYYRPLMDFLENILKTSLKRPSIFESSDFKRDRQQQ